MPDDLRPAVLDMCSGQFFCACGAWLVFRFLSTGGPTATVPCAACARQHWITVTITTHSPVPAAA